jgi:anthranilate phosphoribosyltransferase
MSDVNALDLVTIRGMLSRLVARQSLDVAEAATLLQALTHPSLPPPLAGALLAALSAKGVTAAELQGFATAMRALARRPEIPTNLATLDIVGTGGDASGSFNLSTGAALLTAACGVPIAKHGNRSVSSKSGSADVLEQLGLRIPLDECAAGECLARTGFTFLFAPHYHPAMKAIAPIRQALGVRTVFNILGPLTNPASPPFHLIGAFNLETAQLMASTLAQLPIERCFVVHGAEGWDEPSPVGPFSLFDVRRGEVRAEVRTPEDYGLTRCAGADLAGGDAAYNAQSLRDVLSGAERGAHRDAILLGSALALELVGRAATPRAAIALAQSAIESGAAIRLLGAIAAFSGAVAGGSR